MSVAVAEGRNANPKGRCSRWIWHLFPHVCLTFSLIVYTMLGALMFQQIEKKKNPYDESMEFRAVVHEVVKTVQNHTGPSMQQDFLNEIEKILKTFNTKKQHNQNWTFYGSLLFCCTVFTTVGYGQIYPVTTEGKVACILYALVGIPLMLLLISDVGDMLAVLLSKAYARLSLFFKQLVLNCLRRLQRDGKALPTHQKQAASADDTYNFSPDVVVQESLDIQQVIRTQASFRRKSFQLRNNKEIFDQIIVKENFKHLGENFKSSLTKSSSCPELDRVHQQTDKFFIDIGQEMDKFKVPLLVILLVVFGYIVICSQILRQWENELKPFDAFYFTFITLTTIGFGDIVPKHPMYFMLIFLFIVMGMAILSMAFKLGQSQIVCFYRRCIKCLSMGKVIHKDLESM
ncbi:potassium channel subfamily K member 18-like [Xyrauchen texanus]|uniref:potassium channel subfamily K member 18-like n=1 Tax=Xyrauchen texanus TaxID=154827 RepID=UPI002241BD16|nr:potassium channel subfamily K member 18-like [Xyrauchen texanus]